VETPLKHFIIHFPFRFLRASNFRKTMKTTLDFRTERSAPFKQLHVLLLWHCPTEISTDFDMPHLCHEILKGTNGPYFVSGGCKSSPNLISPVLIVIFSWENWIFDAQGPFCFDSWCVRGKCKNILLKVIYFRFKLV